MELGFPLGKYGTIVADPPWSFEDTGSRIAPDWEGHKIYETMDAEEIFDLPVDIFAAENAHLYLWTTDTHLPLALNCVERWGFRFKKVLVWVKRKAPTTPSLCACGEPEVLRGPQQIGMGHWYRSAKELCLFAVKGSAPGAVHNLTDVIEYPRSQHSRKPDTLLEWAEKMSPGPRIELFARRARSGWEGWGDQFKGHDDFLIALAKANEFRRQGQKTEAKRSRRQGKALKKLYEMREGISRWAARCAVCQTTIGSGETMRYLPDDSVKICLLCAIDAENEIGAAPF